MPFDYALPVACGSTAVSQRARDMLLFAGGPAAALPRAAGRGADGLMGWWLVPFRELSEGICEVIASQRMLWQLAHALIRLDREVDCRNIDLT